MYPISPSSSGKKTILLEVPNDFQLSSTETSPAVVNATKRQQSLTEQSPVEQRAKNDLSILQRKGNPNTTDNKKNTTADTKKKYHRK